ncbi:MAG: hypothetical protein IPI73_12800 [Betaproteobacteria bacterium]|nr:hypothetical protein [Betaproteobacteria bacterium]
MAEINGTTNTFVATTAIHYYPMSVAVNAAGTTAYVPANGGLAAGSVIVPPEVDVINTAAHTYSAIPMTASGAIALTPGETFAYVTGRFSANLYLLNLTTNTLVTGAGFPITVGFNPLAVAISPGGFAYVANSTDGTVSVVNTATNTVVATIPVGTNPQSIAGNPAGTLVYVANSGSNTVSVIDTATNAVVGAPIAVGNHPYGVSVSPGGNLIYVANQFENTVSVIAELTRAAQGPGIPVGTQPTALGKFIKSAAPAVAPTRLAVYIGPPPTVGLPFLVAVQSQDANANPQSVAANTAVTVSRTTGTGTVGGTATCTILAGASSCLLAAATYSVAETGVVLTATRTSGDMLPPGNSMPFRVLPVGPAKLAVASVNGGANPTMGLAFPVVVQSTDNSGAPVNVIVATNVTLSRTGGSGTLGGTLTCTIAAASNSCTAAGVTYSKAEYGVTITATRTAGDPVAAATSAPFTVNSLASPTNRLVVLSVNGGVSPATNTTFNVAIQAQNASGTPVNVVASTGVVLVTKTGTGLLQGSRVCTINAGTNSCTATANYNVASGTESGVVLNAQRNGGDPLGAGDSAPFTVTAASPVPAKLFAFAFLGGPIGSSTPAVGVPFQVGISSADAGGTPASVAVATPVSLAVSAGTGTLGGTVGCTILAGNNGCTASPTYSQVDTGVVLTASGGGLTPGSTSPAFNVVAASPPTKLAILPVDFFDDPRVGIPFSVDVRSADASGNFQLVQSATAVTLSRTAGTGTLGGTLTCTIPAGSSQCLFTNVTYTVAEANVVLTATRTSGDSLATGPSSAFTVSAIPSPPTKLAITIPNANSNVAGFAFAHHCNDRRRQYEQCSHAAADRADGRRRHGRAQRQYRLHHFSAKQHLLDCRHQIAARAGCHYRHRVARAGQQRAVRHRRGAADAAVEIRVHQHQRRRESRGEYDVRHRIADAGFVRNAAKRVRQHRCRIDGQHGDRRAERRRDMHDSRQCQLVHRRRRALFEGRGGRRAYRDGAGDAAAGKPHVSSRRPHRRAPLADGPWVPTCSRSRATLTAALPPCRRHDVPGVLDMRQRRA